MLSYIISKPFLSDSTFCNVLIKIMNFFEPWRDVALNELKILSSFTLWIMVQNCDWGCGCNFAANLYIAAKCGQCRCNCSCGDL